MVFKKNNPGCNLHEDCNCNCPLPIVECSYDPSTNLITWSIENATSAQIIRNPWTPPGEAAIDITLVDGAANGTVTNLNNVNHCFVALNECGTSLCCRACNDPVIQMTPTILRNYDERDCVTVTSGNPGQVAGLFIDWLITLENSGINTAADSIISVLVNGVERINDPDINISFTNNTTFVSGTESYLLTDSPLPRTVTIDVVTSCGSTATKTLEFDCCQVNFDYTVDMEDFLPLYSRTCETLYDNPCVSYTAPAIIAVNSYCEITGLDGLNGTVGNYVRGQTFCFNQGFAYSDNVRVPGQFKSTYTHTYQQGFGCAEVVTIFRNYTLDGFFYYGSGDFVGRVMFEVTNEKEETQAGTYDGPFRDQGFNYYFMVGDIVVNCDDNRRTDCTRSVWMHINMIYVAQQTPNSLVLPYTNEERTLVENADCENPRVMPDANIISCICTNPPVAGLCPFPGIPTTSLALHGGLVTLNNICS